MKTLDGGWVEGWMDGWMDGWQEAKAGLRIAYSNQKLKILVLKIDLINSLQKVKDGSGCS